jgi:hypothetical protein
VRALLSVASTLVSAGRSSSHSAATTLVGAARRLVPVSLLEALVSFLSGCPVVLTPTRRGSAMEILRTNGWDPGIVGWEWELEWGELEWESVRCSSRPA